jgi:single-strand DNA-binding protein
VHEPHITVVGHVAAAPRFRLTPAGISVADFRVAVTPRRRDAEGAWSDRETIWFSVTAWRQLAEHCSDSLKKGDRAVVTGRLQTSTWETEQGERRSNLEIVAESVGLELSRGNASYVKAPTLVTTEDPDVLRGDVDPATGEVRVGGALDPAEPEEPEDLDLVRDEAAAEPTTGSGRRRAREAVPA